MPPASWREQMTALLADNAAGISALRTIALREKPFGGARPPVPFRGAHRGRSARPGRR